MREHRILCFSFDSVSSCVGRIFFCRPLRRTERDEKKRKIMPDSPSPSLWVRTHQPPPSVPRTLIIRARTQWSYEELFIIFFFLHIVTAQSGKKTYNFACFASLFIWTRWMSIGHDANYVYQIPLNEFFFFFIRIHLAVEVEWSERMRIKEMDRSARWAPRSAWTKTELQPNGDHMWAIPPFQFYTSSLYLWPSNTFIAHVWLYILQYSKCTSPIHPHYVQYFVTVANRLLLRLTLLSFINKFPEIIIIIIILTIDKCWIVCAKHK